MICITNIGRRCGYKKARWCKLNDQLGLNPGMRSFQQMWSQGQLAVVQGVGYPNPDRSHFESMDIWQTADPHRNIKTGWLGAASTNCKTRRFHADDAHRRRPAAARRSGHARRRHHRQ